jgi:hypothetical protein
LVRQEANASVEERARGKTIDKHAWLYLKDNIKALPVRRRLDLVFHERPDVRATLDKDYTVRNEAAHDYRLPSEAKDVSAWLNKLQDLVDEFKG